MAERVTIHGLRHGAALCGFHPGLPEEWPDLHLWDDSKDMVNCEKCLAIWDLFRQAVVDDDILAAAAVTLRGLANRWASGGVEPASRAVRLLPLVEGIEAMAADVGTQGVSGVFVKDE